MMINMKAELLKLFLEKIKSISVLSYLMSCQLHSNRFANALCKTQNGRYGL